MRLGTSLTRESRSNSCDSSSEDHRPPLTPKKQVVRIMHGALEKKDFFLDKVCPLYFSKKYSLSKNKHIHRKVKCVHLVPESGRHMVSGSKKKSPRRNSYTQMHHQMHHTDVVLEFAGKQSTSLVARSKKIKITP